MIDARGLSCPQPVLLVQRFVKANKPELVEVVVDHEAAVQNITRYANSQGYCVEKAADGDDTKLTLRK